MNSTQESQESQIYQIQEKMAALEAALNEATPGLPTLLREIHGQLKKDPNLVTILTEDECSILVRGLKVQTSTEIAKSVLKKASGKKAQSKLTLADL